jgi:S-formylglutathione hydrolase FrmB
MRKLFFVLFLLFSVSAMAQNGVVKESLAIESKLLGYPVKYSVYLPAGYESSQRSYPVLYLLHGYSDDETGWTQFG